MAGSECRATGWLESADTLASLAAVAALGCRVSLVESTLVVGPAPAFDFSAPVTIDCRNSGTTARLLLGLLAGRLPVGGPGVILTGDQSLSSRPMARVVDPLRAMGADLEYLSDDGRLPIRIAGASLTGRSHSLPVASAQLKSALLLAGLSATGETVVAGGGDSRDHTERMLSGLGAPVESDAQSDVLRIGGCGELPGYELRIPGDPSTAAFLQVAAALIPGSRLVIENQSLNPGRCGALDVLVRAGVQVTRRPDAAAGAEPSGSVEVATGSLRAVHVGAPEIPALVDELPVLAVLATQADGVSEITGAAELRVKESDRIAAMAIGLQAMGAHITERPDGWRIEGPSPLRGGAAGDPILLESRGDHRVAMALAVAALLAKGETALDDDACVAVSYPDFFEELTRLVRE